MSILPCLPSFEDYFILDWSILTYIYLVKRVYVILNFVPRNVIECAQYSQQISNQSGLITSFRLDETTCEIVNAAGLAIFKEPGESEVQVFVLLGFKIGKWKNNYKNYSFCVTLSNLFDSGPCPAPVNIYDRGYTIKSPLYDEDEGYPQNQECVWYLSTEPGSFFIGRFMDIFRVWNKPG